MGWISSILFCGLFIFSVKAQDPRPDVICATNRFADQCDQLQRGNSEVSCQRVQDSIECAARIRNGTATFGVFTAESALQLAFLSWSDLTVVKELRHRDRQNAPVDFESVVIVRNDHNGGINGLKGLKFCHPGLFYDRSQRWTERFLKHFERTVVPVDCQNERITSPAELEAAALAFHFGDSCRPGSWSNNFEEDLALKLKYPSLCALCSSQPGNNNCTYETDGQGSRHLQALQCLTSGGGQVTYVSLQEARTFFLEQNIGSAAEYSYLCPNGTMQSITNENLNPCVWLRQPWKLIISNSAGAVQLSTQINNWMRNTGTWQSALQEILTADNYMVYDPMNIQNPQDYFRSYRQVPITQTLCSTLSRWCTSSLEERQKCDVISAGGVTTGIYPLIECIEQTNGVVGCLNEVSSGRADLTGIDSNLGYLARHPYNLAAAVYAETEYSKYSSVVVVVRSTSSYERFENLKGSRACFAEYGGIASMAFINTGKNRSFFNKNECNYGQLLGNFFQSACVPGALDFAHDGNSTNPSNLCSLCQFNITTVPPTITTTVLPINPILREDGSIDENPSENLEGGEIVDGEAQPDQQPSLDDAERQNTVTEPQQVLTTCSADSTNRFFGNIGALRCLSEVGDVAILELQYLREHAQTLNLNEHDFRIMCRNGSLAATTGFDVDLGCALTTIIDGEVVTRPNDKKLPGIINALSSFDKYFQFDPDFKLYNIFNGQRHLLFKDSTIGLVAPSDPNLGQQVVNYKQLFGDLEVCANKRASSASSVTINTIFAILLPVMLTMLFN